MNTHETIKISRIENKDGLFASFVYVDEYNNSHIFNAVAIRKRYELLNNPDAFVIDWDDVTVVDGVEVSVWHGYGIDVEVCEDLALLEREAFAEWIESFLTTGEKSQMHTAKDAVRRVIEEREARETRMMDED